MDESEELLERTRDAVVALARRRRPHRRVGVVNQKVKEPVAKFLYNETHRRPMVLPVAVEV